MVNSFYTWNIFKDTTIWNGLLGITRNGGLRKTKMYIITQFRNKVGHLVDGDVWDMEYSEKTNPANRNKLYTTEEREKRRRELLSVKLP